MNSEIIYISITPYEKLICTMYSAGSGRVARGNYKSRPLKNENRKKVNRKITSNHRKSQLLSKYS